MREGRGARGRRGVVEGMSRGCRGDVERLFRVAGLLLALVAVLLESESLPQLVHQRNRRPDVLGEEFGLLHGREVPASLHPRHPHQVLVAVAQQSLRLEHYLVGELSAGARHFHRESGKTRQGLGLPRLSLLRVIFRPGLLA
jgi:hypothetical protein